MVEQYAREKEIAKKAKGVHHYNMLGKDPQNKPESPVRVAKVHTIEEDEPEDNDLFKVTAKSSKRLPETAKNSPDHKKVKAIIVGSSNKDNVDSQSTLKSISKIMKDIFGSSDDDIEEPVKKKDTEKYDKPSSKYPNYKIENIYNPFADIG